MAEGSGLMAKAKHPKANPKIKNTSIDIVHYEWPHSLTNYDPSFGAKHIFTYMESVSLRLLMDLEYSEVLSKTWLEKIKDLIHALRLEFVDSAMMDARIAVTNKDGEFLKKIRGTKN